MRLNQIMSADGQEAYLAERRAPYFAKAEKYLATHFAPLCAPLQPPTLRAVVESAFHDARAWGFRTERELLRYLIPTALLGEGFAGDPLLRPLLRAAFWINAQDQPLRSPGFPRLFDVVDMWHRRRRRDLDAPDRFATALSAPLPAQITYPDAQRLFHACWPNLLQNIPPDVLRRFADTGLKALQSDGIGLDVAVRLLAVQVGAGHRAGRASFHPDLCAAAREGRFDATAGLAALTSMETSA